MYPFEKANYYLPENFVKSNVNNHASVISATIFKEFETEIGGFAPVEGN